MMPSGLSTDRLSVRAAILSTLFALSACSSPPAGPAATPKPVATFDLSAVKAEFSAECKGPGVLTEITCDAIDIAGMTAQGLILNVPTNLAPTADNVAELICSQVMQAGTDLGFQTVGILDSAGGNLYAC